MGSSTSDDPAFVQPEPSQAGVKIRVCSCRSDGKLGVPDDLACMDRFLHLYGDLFQSEGCRMSGEWPKVSTKHVQCYQVRSKEDGAHEWARFYVHGGPHRKYGMDRDGSSVEITIASSFGSWTYYWPRLGDDAWWIALNRSDMDYIMNKFTSGDYKEFSASKTMQVCRGHVLSMRREGSITHEEARNALDELDLFDDDDLMNSTLFMQRLCTIPIFQDEYWEWAREEVKPGIKRFWELLWIPWLEYLNGKGT